MATQELALRLDSPGTSLTVPERPFQQATPPIGEALATLACAVLGIAGWVLNRALPDSPEWAISIWTGALLAGGLLPTLRALAAVRHGELTIDLLMILAASGAVVIGDWAEGVVLLFLFSLSGTLEAFAMYRTTRSIESLVRLRPREALRLSDGTFQRVPIESLSIGDVVQVLPGERFAVDGLVLEGESWADESTLTGESEAIHKLPGAPVFAGTMNGRGNVQMRMTKAVADSTLERIVHMVRDAQAQKTPTQRFVESWQRPYVLGVLAAALFVFVGACTMHTTSFHDAFYHAMVLLVAASPCAVVLSSPAVMLSAIARAGRSGVLFKGAVHLEELGKVEVIAFDKTGTLTAGKPSVTEFWTAPGVDASRVLRLAAMIEKRSEHPLGVPVVEEALRRGIALPEETIRDFHSHTGLGVHGRIGGFWVGIGREGLFEEHGVPVPAELISEASRMRESGQTALLVVVFEGENAAYGGVLSVADAIRPESAATIRALKRLGITKAVMLTGDHERVARSVANQIGADEYRAGLLPDQKVRELQMLSREGGIAMVGDGVNDAPALATAQVGIAMGGAGTDVALEVADVVLMSDDLRALPFAVAISRLACRRVRQNMIFAFGMISVLVLATFFNLPLWLGVVGHEGSTVLVVLNGLRILGEPDMAAQAKPSKDVAAKQAV